MKLQSEHEGSDVQVELNVEHQPDMDVIPNMTRLPRVKYITYYEDSESLPGKRTAVWELDKGIQFSDLQFCVKLIVFFNLCTIYDRFNYV